jgi:Glycosyltransferases involved in cell wall biogenesis
VDTPDPTPHTLSVVIPVYRGERTLPDLVQEIAGYAAPFLTPAGSLAVVAEVLLVFDHGPDGSARVIRELSAAYNFVRPIWLSRNFGQHAATLAGMASSGGDWIVTLDEDGQYDPADIAAMLDTAIAEGADVVYGSPTNAAPHGPLRNLASVVAKRITDVLVGSRNARNFHSFRLVLGEIGRSVAAYSGSGVYLDVALSWVASQVTTSPVKLRAEGRASGYSLPRLLSHFWRLVLTSGTRSLRFVTSIGVVMAASGAIFAVVITLRQLLTGVVAEGWTSLMVVLLVAAGFVILFLGVIAEYLGVAVNMAMGRPPYLITSDPANGPLGRPRPDAD